MWWIMGGCIVAAISAVIALCFCVVGGRSEKAEEKWRNKK